MTFLRKNREKI